MIRRERPIRPGSSIGAIGGNAGTATILVRRQRADDRHTYLLGCEHVMRPKSLRSEPVIVQPAVQDSTGTGSRNIVGHGVHTAGLSEEKTNYVDAAIVRLLGSVKPQNFTTEGNCTIYDIGREISPDMQITMVGRSSGKVQGRVMEPEFKEALDYTAMGWRKPLKFAGLAKCEYVCRSGDSGAPVINTETGQLIGLHIAGIAGVGLFCPIWRVFDALQIELI